MRELLVTMTLLSLVSSEEFETKKRFGIPSEEDPNFWPARGRRSYWGNSIRQDLPQGPEVNYASHPFSWAGENDFSLANEAVDFPEGPMVDLCERRKPLSLFLPIPEYRPDESGFLACGRRCHSLVQARGRRRDERWRRQQPLYAEEPGWIAINYDRGLLGSSKGDEDPFIVARGKKQGKDGSLDLRERRQLEDVISSYDTDPFFVARGKRAVFSTEGSEGPQSFGTKSANKLDSKPRIRRGSEKPSNSEEEPRVSSADNQKLLDISSRKIPGENEYPVLTSPELEEEEEEEEQRRHERIQRSSTDSFEADDNKWVKTDVVNSHGDGDEFSQVKPRYSRPRDKHSNLQSILDEPFFVSRGKKGKEDGSLGFYGYKSPIKIGNDFGYETGVFDSPKTEELELLLSSILDGKYKRDSVKTHDKPPRNRRGMLEDLLKEDDPFYVARGKRLYYQNPTGFDTAINDAELSLLDKESREKLRRKYSELSKMRNKNYPKGAAGRDF